MAAGYRRRVPETLRYEIVDVFTDRPFAGNPLAVVRGGEGLPTAALQALAAEFNLSETAFPLPADAPGVDYRVRIFTPATELPFAGHPSVGTAWVLARDGEVGRGRVVQRCGAGDLELWVAEDLSRVRLTGGRPELGPRRDAAAYAAAAGLGRDAVVAGAPCRDAGTGLPWTYLLVADAAVGAARPDLARLRDLGADPYLLSWDAAGRVAHARAFGGSVGVTEDPATGSAALGLGCYLVAAGLLPGEGESDYRVVQGRELGRPSRLDCRVLARGGLAVRCQVAGGVVPVARGEVAVPPIPPHEGVLVTSLQ